ncbi:Formate/nitrite transporter family protein [Trichomonas vaginalis G3]|uniref:Formate/nitrite transporter family protein n=1 Tax=Trichomonas vaginalis (strain ATCC PRA-98 / G3) TaxID=412133 RepID=A2EXA6_TRIV3|nr:formate/nitrite transporter [Trichomonas vaginalis G3]EAY02705.1 Formate/nitrite transporter family protein [Trichomonas vaginalis G3]KAI5513510.1 formate/nitrite transporter [Trichomonas vaginalis G3]|eukprot:XP_001314928.1 Formate/nitrite transporter family protein [Trichomonas vaginalis G3]
MKPTTLISDMISYGEAANRITDAGAIRAYQNVWNFMIRSFLSGVMISFSFLFGVVAQLESGQTIMFALCFAIGLHYIIFLNDYLFTGDFVPICLAGLNRRAPAGRLIYAAAMTYVFNALGCIFGAFFTGWATGVSRNPYDGFVGQKVAAVCFKKTHMKYHEMFVRAMACNALVSIATFMANMSQTFCGKCLAVFMAIGNFSTMSLEHCMANWFCLANGIMQVNGPKNMTWKNTFINLILVSLGNMVGSFVIVSCPAYMQQYFEKKKQQQLQAEQHEDKESEKEDSPNVSL